MNHLEKIFDDGVSRTAREWEAILWHIGIPRFEDPPLKGMEYLSNAVIHSVAKNGVDDLKENWSKIMENMEHKPPSDEAIEGE